MRAPVRPLAAATVVLALAGCAAGTDAAPTAAPTASPTPTPAATPAPVELDLAELEGRLGVRVGLYALDTGTGATVVHRADERFAFASTFKAVLAGAILLLASDAQLDGNVPIDAADVEANSPVTDSHVGDAMTMRELCDAAVRYSDNTAANLLLRELGGPDRLETVLRDLGDDVTSLDRWEPELSEATPGDIRDTTTARVAADDLEAFALGEVLTPDRRDQLVDWLQRNTTGDTMIRSVAPTGWVVGDKTGSGGYGTRNDIAILWPPDGAPIVLAIFTDRGVAGAKRLDAAVAEAAQLALAALGRP